MIAKVLAIVAGTAVAVNGYTLVSFLSPLLAARASKY